MHPVLFQTHLFHLLGEPWSLHTYGLLIAMGFLLAMQLASRQGAQEGEDPEQVIDVTFYLLLAGLVGARVVYILTQLPTMLAHPSEIFMFWRGGLVWYGGFLGAFVALVLYTRKHRLNLLKYVDVLIGPMALAHAFGRVGCLFAGCCYGSLTKVPWAIVFPPGSMAQQDQHLAGLVSAVAPALPVHPTQLYEALGELLLFWLVTYVRPTKRFHGQLFLIWLTAYPILRSLIEMLRGDKERGVWLLSTSQYISIAVGAAALVLTVLVRRRQVAQTAQRLKDA
jgi:phosphatidylglycerol:prolipoprotein diacylglycerol transferase